MDCGENITDILPWQHYEGIGVCAGGETTYDSECLLQCEPGYEGLVLPFTCGPDGEWEGDRSKTCSPVHCGDINAPLALVNAETPRCRVEPILGARCPARCKNGFLGAPADAVCGTQGEWESEIDCQPINCGEYLPLVEGSATKRDTSQRGLVDIGDCGTRFTDPACRPNCTRGYPDRLSVGADIVCQANGQWAGTFRCTGVTEASSAVETGTAVGLSVGGIILAILLVLLVLVLFRRRQGRKTQSIYGQPRRKDGQIMNPLHHSFKGRPKAKVRTRGSGKEHVCEETLLMSIAL